MWKWKILAQEGFEKHPIIYIIWLNYCLFFICFKIWFDENMYRNFPHNALVKHFEKVNKIFDGEWNISDGDHNASVAVWILNKT